MSPLSTQLRNIETSEMTDKEWATFKQEHLDFVLMLLNRSSDTYTHYVHNVSFARMQFIGEKISQDRDCESIQVVVRTNAMAKFMVSNGKIGNKGERSEYEIQQSSPDKPATLILESRLSLSPNMTLDPFAVQSKIDAFAQTVLAFSSIEKNKIHLLRWKIDVWKMDSNQLSELIHILALKGFSSELKGVRTVVKVDTNGENALQCEQALYVKLQPKDQALKQEASQLYKPAFTKDQFYEESKKIEKAKESPFTYPPAKVLGVALKELVGQLSFIAKQTPLARISAHNITPLSKVTSNTLLNHVKSMGCEAWIESPYNKLDGNGKLLFVRELFVNLTEFHLHKKSVDS